ncbi:hypothetical protein MRX96_007108 [Rhipicephalus microplus]
MKLNCGRARPGGLPGKRLGMAKKTTPSFLSISAQFLDDGWATAAESDGCRPETRMRDTWPFITCPVIHYFGSLFPESARQSPLFPGRINTRSAGRFKLKLEKRARPALIITHRGGDSSWRQFQRWSQRFSPGP